MTRSVPGRGQDRAVGEPVRDARRDRQIAVALAAASIAVGAFYALLGPGYVLDDWFLLGNARVDGALRAAGHANTSGHPIWVNRPGSGVVFTLQFGMLGGHPLAGLVVLTALSAATAVLVFVLARQFLPRTVAAAIAFVWIVLPNHTSLEFWQACAPLAVAAVMVLVGSVVVARPEPSARRWLCALALLTAGILTYEAVLPAAVLAAASLPAFARRQLSFRALYPVCGLLPAAIYVVLFRNTQTAASSVAPLQQMVPGHFGWGIVPSGPGATVVMALAMVVVVISITRLLLPGFRAGTGTGERLIVVGAALVVAGTIPFAFYLYAPLGAGDRFNLISAIGGAVAWVGIALVLWRWRPLVLAASLSLLVMATAARVQRTNTWTTAAADGRRVEAAIVARYPKPPSEPIVLGPSPVQRTNIAAFLDQSNVTGMLRYVYGTDVPGGIAYSEADFNRFPPQDRFDVHALSRLRPDVDLSR